MRNSDDTDDTDDSDIESSINSGSSSNSGKSSDSDDSDDSIFDLIRYCRNIHDIENLVSRIHIDPESSTRITESGRTTIHAAIAWIDQQYLPVVLYLLIRAGAPVNVMSRHSSNTAAHMLSDSGDVHFDSARTLLTSGTDVDINIQNNKGDTPLHIALFSAAPKIALLWINSGANVNILNNSSLLPTHYVQSPDVMKVLIDHGANIKGKLIKGKLDTPLCHAITGNYVDVVVELLRHVTLLDYTDDEADYHVKLAQSYKGRDTKIPELLRVAGLERSLAPLFQLSNKWPLHDAIQSRSIDSFIELLAARGTYNINPNQLNGHKCSPMRLVLETKGKKDIKDINQEYTDQAFMLRALIVAGADVNETSYEDESLLRTAICKRNPKIANILIAAGASVTNENSSNEDSCEEDNTDLELMMASGDYDMSVFDRTISISNPQARLMEAVESGNIRNIEYLVTCHHADVNVYDESDIPVIFTAAKSGVFEVVKHLVLSRHANPVVKTNDGQTALHYAVLHPMFEKYGVRGKLKTIDFLARYIDVNSVDCGGYTPLHRAIQWCFNEAVDLLIKLGADVNKPVTGKTEITDQMITDAVLTNDRTSIAKLKAISDHQHTQYTPLHIAAAFKNCNVMHVLVENGAIHSAVNRIGETAMHISAGVSDIDSMITLIELEASYIIQDKLNGSTPIHIIAMLGSLNRLLQKLDSNNDILQNVPTNNAGKIPEEYMTMWPEQLLPDDESTEASLSSDDDDVGCDFSGTMEHEQHYNS